MSCEERLEQAKALAARYKVALEPSFKAGWKAGYDAGGESDCRRFDPSAECDWKRYAAALAEEKTP